MRYEKLEGFLKNKQWKEADDETFRVMLEVLGKEKDDYFTREELLNFPCKDLLKIDGLWLEYSKINGVSKFGFSLQKEILKKCGYKLDGSDPPSEVWYDF
ncbi:MAG: GUN4 domain-containing protein [Coleofasciculaceae cyanobacterium SM2_1_6]|nr:GUN4 domain-containing protein [Coleofasciculaceae cyanobacterium SM2_1_6]